MLKTRPTTNNESFEEISRRLKSASDKRRVATWELVDELLHARETLGERFWQAVEVTQLSQGAVDSYMRTGEAWPVNKRFLNMPFDCHTALNTLDPDRRTAAMTMALKAKWDRDELRRRVAAWKAGDEKAFDYRHKVEAPERPARKIVDVPETLAGEGSLNGSKEDGPVFDKTEAGVEMDAELRAENRREFKEARAERSFSTATEKLAYALALVKAMRSDPEFRAGLDAGAISASDCEVEGHWLVNLARDIRHQQNTEFENPKPARKGGASCAPAQGEADGALPRTASPERAAKGRVQVIDGIAVEQPDEIPANLRR